MPDDPLRPSAVLTAAQRAAVTAPAGPLLVLAGAGAGKTRVLTERIGFRLRAGTARPGSTLAITFTTRVARELRERLATSIGDDAARLTIGTFHSVCHRLLRAHAPMVGRTSAFSIYDDHDRRALLRQAIGRQPLELADATRAIGLAKARLWTPGRLLTAARDQRDRRIARAWATYDELLADADALDFDDLLVLAVRLWEEHPHALQAARDRWTFVLVDEYQDVNPVQARWLDLLCGTDGDLTVAGDDDQAVYGFRSASVRHILEFPRRHPDGRTVTLGVNHRSSGAIVATARALVEHNASRHPKPLRSAAAAGPGIRLSAHPDEHAEADAAAVWVRTRLDAGLAAAEVAVLCRTRQQTAAIDTALARRGIAHQVLGGRGLLEQADVRDALAWLTLAVNPHDRLAFARAVQAPRRGIGPAAIARLIDDAGRRDGDLVRACGTAHGLLRDRQAVAAEDFADTVLAVRARRDAPDVGATVIDALQRSGLPARLPEPRRQHLRELVTLARAYAQRARSPDLAGWLAGLRLDHDDAHGIEQVSLATVHAAKGLEWGAVLVCGLEEGTFPHARAASEGLEEERRLAYVALTRARHTLAVSWAAQRDGRPQRVSRFVAEMGLGGLRRAA